MKRQFPYIESNILETLCKTLGEALTNTEIDKYLADSGLKNVEPVGTKWRRLYNSFVEYQNRTQVSNGILKFVQISIHPTRFVHNKELFEATRTDLNKIFSFIGLQLGENGKFRGTEKATTISQAEQRASLLFSKLEDRNVHPEVLKFCKSELVENNYFHAVFEAVKSVADKIRSLSGETKDGSGLVDAVFSVNDPILIINDLRTETEKSEQKGFANLLKGFFGMFRNTVAHEPKIKWKIEEYDALNVMTLASLFHRRLDNSTKIR